MNEGELGSIKAKTDLLNRVDSNIIVPHIFGDSMGSIIGMKNLIEVVPQDEGLSVHQLVLRTGLDPRTVVKYLDIIMDIQNMPKIEKRQVGLRILIQKA